MLRPQADKWKLVRSLPIIEMCQFADEIKTAVRDPLLKRRCGESKKTNVYCLTPHLFSQSLTAQALFTQKNKTGKIQTAIPCECLLGEGVLRTQAVKRSLIQGVLIQLLCLFEDGTRAARRREKRAPNLTNSTSDCAVRWPLPGAQSAVA